MTRVVTRGCSPPPSDGFPPPSLSRPSVMNNLPACLVLSDMRIHRQNGRSGALAGRQDNVTDAPAGRLRWRPRRRDRGNARRAPGSGTAGDQTAPGDQTVAVRAAPSETAATAMHCQPPTVNSRYLLSVLVDEPAEDPGQAR